MPNITRWSPDTCECIIDIEGDWELPQSVKSIHKCKPHELLPDGLPHLTVVWREENQVKNKTLGIAQAIESTLDSENYIWSFDANRKLLVSFAVAVSISNKNGIQAACDAEFGAGKVKIS